MEILRLKRLTVDELAEEMPNVKKDEQFIKLKNYMKNKLLTLIGLILFCFELFSQEESLFYEKNFSAFTNYFEENYGINCKDFKNFSCLTYNTIWVPKNDSQRSTAFLFGPVLQSKDKECLLAYPCTNIFFHPLNQIIAEIKSGLGTYNRISVSDDTSDFEFQNYVTIIVGKKVRKMFNADTLYIYDIPNADSSVFLNEELENIRKENYPYCKGIAICKEARISTQIRLFFSEKGKLKENDYIKMLSKKIWYSDTFENKINWYMVDMVD